MERVSLEDVSHDIRAVLPRKIILNLPTCSSVVLVTAGVNEHSRWSFAILSRRRQLADRQIQLKTEETNHSDD